MMEMMYKLHSLEKQMEQGHQYAMFVKMMDIGYVSMKLITINRAKQAQTTSHRISTPRYREVDDQLCHKGQ